MSSFYSSDSLSYRMAVDTRTLRFNASAWSIYVCVNVHRRSSWFHIFARKKTATDSICTNFYQCFCLELSCSIFTVDGMQCQSGCFCRQSFRQHFSNLVNEQAEIQQWKIPKLNELKNQCRTFRRKTKPRHIRRSKGSNRKHSNI